MEPMASVAVVTSEGLMWIAGSKLSREEMVNLLACTRVKKELDRQVLTGALRGSLRLSLVNSILVRAKVNGSFLGHFKEGGARIVAPLGTAFT